MKFYLAGIEHQCAKTEEIEAESLAEAEAKLEQMYEQGQLIFNDVHFDYVQMTEFEMNPVAKNS